MKKKKGFTLIELIVTLSIVASIMVIAVVSLNKISKRKKEEAYKVVVNEVKTAAKQYFDTNEYLFEGLSGEAAGIISIDTLISNDFLNKVVDPRTGKELSHCDQIEVIKKDNKYHTKYVKSKDDKCESNNSVVVKEIGGPKISAYFYNTSNNVIPNKDLKTITYNGNEWYNIKSVGNNSGSIGVYVKTDENNNGPIVNILVKNMDTGDEKVKYVDSKGIYYDKESYGTETDLKTVAYTAVNSAGKIARVIKSARVDMRNPSIALNYDDQEIKDKWQRKPTDPLMSSKGNSYIIKVKDNLKVDFITSYWNKYHLTESEADKIKYVGGNSSTINVEKEEYTTHGTFKEYGKRKIYSEVCDFAGNCVDSNELVYRFDGDKPSLTIENNFENKWATGPVQLTYITEEKYSGVNKWEYSFDGNKWYTNIDSVGKKIYKNSTNGNNPDGGNYFTNSVSNLLVKVTDNVGYTNSTTTKFKIDDIPPVASITNPSGGNWTNNSVQLTYVATENESGIAKWQYSTDGRNWYDNVNSKGKNSYTNDDGTNGNIYHAQRNNKVYARAIDNAGNYSNEPGTWIKIDKTAPQCGIERSGSRARNGQSYWYNGKVSLTSTCSDEGGSGCSSNSSSDSYNYQDNFIKTFTFYDGAGNSGSCSTSFGIDWTPPTMSTPAKSCLGRNCAGNGYSFKQTFNISDNLSGTVSPYGYNHCYDHPNSKQPALMCHGYESSGSYSTTVKYTSYADRGITYPVEQHYGYGDGLKDWYHLFYRYEDNAGNISWYRYKLNYVPDSKKHSIHLVGHTTGTVD